MSVPAKYLLQGVWVYFLSKNAVKVGSFLSFLLVTNKLALFDYGQLQLLFSILGPAALFVTFNLDKVIVADAAGFRGDGNVEKSKLLFKHFFLFCFLNLLIILFSGYFLQNFFSSLFSFSLQKYFVPLALLIIGQMVMNGVSMVFSAFEKFNYVSYLQTGESLLRLFIIVCLYFFDNIFVISVFCSYIAAKIGVSIIGCYYSFLLLRNNSLHTVKEKSPFFLLLRKHGKWDIGNGIVDTLSSSLTPWILQFFGGTVAVGVYSFAEKIVSYIVGIIPIDTVLFPFINKSIKNKKENTLFLIMKAKKYIFFLYVFLFLIFAVFMRPFVILFAKEYMAAIPFILILMLNMFIEVFAIGQSPLLYSYKKQRALFTVRWFVIPLRIVSQIVFVYFFDVWGLVISVLSMSFFSASVREYLLRTLGIKLWNWKYFFTFDDYDRSVLRFFLKKIKYRYI